MIFDILHKWDVPPKKAIELQKILACQIQMKPLNKKINLVAGADIAISADCAIACVVVFSLPNLSEVERKIVKGPLAYPYVPGLLSFREAPVLLDAFAGLESKPDLVMFDGQGIAHPRRMGLASHMGLWLKIPTIGCAKSLLCGSYREPKIKAGSMSYIKAGKDKIGVCLRTKDSTRPVFISPGHLIDFGGAVAVVKKCLDGFRIPKPTRIADKLAGIEAKKCIVHLRRRLDLMVSS